MADPFLICHKVRGEPAFDVAIQMDCPLCQGGIDPMCIECDDLGYWWIIPTSGHRAYPYWSEELRLLIDWPMQEINNNPLPPAIPPSLPDHYQLSTPRPTTSLVDALGLRKPKVATPSTPVARRF